MCRIERFRRAAIFRFITSGNRRVLTVHLLQTPALNIGIRLADMSHTMHRPVRTGLHEASKVCESVWSHSETQA